MAPNETLTRYNEENVEAIPLMGAETDAEVLLERPISKSEERVGRIQFLALCFSLFMVGWSDGSVGPLLPRIMQVYSVCPSLKITFHTVSPPTTQNLTGQLRQFVIHFCSYLCGKKLRKLYVIAVSQSFAGCRYRSVGKHAFE